MQLFYNPIVLCYRQSLKRKSIRKGQRELSPQPRTPLVLKHGTRSAWLGAASWPRAREHYWREPSGHRALLWKPTNISIIYVQRSPSNAGSRSFHLTFFNLEPRFCKIISNASGSHVPLSCYTAPCHAAAAAAAGDPNDWLTMSDCKRWVPSNVVENEGLLLMRIGSKRRLILRCVCFVRCIFMSNNRHK